MLQNPGTWKRRTTRLLSDPITRFFSLGAIIFVAHRWFIDDPHTIEIGHGLRADLQRQFQDRMGEAPNPTETEGTLRSWKLDEALYREALRINLDRDDAAIRALLIDKLRAQIALESWIPEPTDADLDQWLAQHQDLYETQTLYEHEYIVFARNEDSAAQRRATAEHALRAGASPSQLGLRSVAAKISRERIEQDFGTDLANQICSLPLREWQALDGPASLLLVHMMDVTGGLPSREKLHTRLTADWQSAMRQRVVERESQAILARYRFEERSK